MNKFITLLLAFGVFAMTGCSKKEEPKVKAPSAQEVQRLKSDSERLQQATANAAKARERAAAVSPTPSATATPSP